MTAIPLSVICGLAIANDLNTLFPSNAAIPASLIRWLERSNNWSRGK